MKMISKVKICTKCKESKPNTSEYFNKGSSNKDGLTPFCKICNSKRAKEYYINNRSKLLEQKKDYCAKNKDIIKLKNRAQHHKNKKRNNLYSRVYHHKHKDVLNKKNAEYRLTPIGIYNELGHHRKDVRKCTGEEFVKWHNNEPKVCKYCDLPEEYVTHIISAFSRNDKRLSVDRLDPKGGYELGNMALCCFTCNLVKSDYFTAQEMQEIAQKYIKPKWQEKIKKLGLTELEERDNVKVR